MKVIILAGGFGTRLSEYTYDVPKPMVNIGSLPILWHLMKIYAFYNHKEFYNNLVQIPHSLLLMDNYYHSRTPYIIH